MCKRVFWSLVLTVLFYHSSVFAKNKVIFEGFYKITLHQAHVGYYIQRYELDSARKQFISTYFLRTNKAGGNVAESLIAHSTEKFGPVKYKYTLLQGKQAITIDAGVVRSRTNRPFLNVTKTQGGKKKVFRNEIKKGTFFSTFLMYLILQSKKGVTVGEKYDFKAVAEEDGKIYPGEVFVEKEEKFKGFNTYKILNTFKDTQFINFVNKNGESLKSFSPARGLSAELVADPSKATAGLAVSDTSLKLIFGDVPQGKENLLSKRLKDKTANPVLSKQPALGSSPNKTNSLGTPAKEKKKEEKSQ